MSTREIRAAELDALLALYAHLHAVDDPLPERSTVEATWQELHESPYFRYFGTTIDGRLISSCTISVIPNLTRGCRPYGVIENVVTHESFRRRGYGRAILNHALEYAWSKNCYKVMLLTGRKDEKIYQFYESVGFDRGAKQAFLAKPLQTGSGA